jgi:hypothetical protein
MVPEPRKRHKRNATTLVGREQQSAFQTYDPNYLAFDQKYTLVAATTPKFLQNKFEIKTVLADEARAPSDSEASLSLEQQTYKLVPM